MVEQRLEQENKSTEMVQYIGNEKIKTETGCENKNGVQEDLNRIMKTEMWLGISEVVWGSWRAMI